MALQGATQAVGAGAVTAAVAGSFPATYQVGIRTSWVTALRVTAKTATQFTIDFATPCPAGGGEFDWTAGVAISPSSSASQAVGAGLSTVTIVGAFSSVYQVALAPGWVTDYDVVSQSGGSFVINFSIPAPAGGSTVDWIAVVQANTISAVTAVTPITAASQVLAAGATNLVVAPFGALPAAYEVTVAPGWVTGWDVVSKTTAGFTINFAVPVPAGGATVYWIVFGPNLGAVSLSDYLAELRDLLHDPSDRYWSAIQKTRYINSAMKRRDIDTGSNRQLLSFTLTAGTGLYTLGQIGNGQAFDLYSINLIFGSTRILLQHLPKTELDMKFRPWTTHSSQPWAFARYGPSQVYLAPTPNSAYVTEWDCAVYASPLLNLTDLDPLPYPFTQPVPYYAAYLAKINMQMDDEAQAFLERYEQQLNIATNGRVGRVPNQYSGLQMLR